jgi:hypothetical protein
VIETPCCRHTPRVKNYVTSLAPIAALLMLACDEPKNVGDSGGSEGASAEGGVDCEGEGEGDWGESGEGDTGEGDTGGTPGDGDCSLGEYVPLPWSDEPDWTNVSGLVNHSVSSDSNLSNQYVDARFYTTDYVDDSSICIESIVEPTGVDSCWVWYTLGEGLGNPTPDNWFEDLPVESVTFDLGAGPIALDVSPGTELNPSWYSAELPPPPAGVPFGGFASLIATFDGLPALAFDLEVPSDILPLGHALDTATLSSEELASWTWATPGGAEPVELEVSLGASPAGSGWSELVRIQCQVTDDGEFAFPVEYIDLARERLGPELYASMSLTREATGTRMLAGKQLIWRSNITAWLGIELID